MSTDVTTFCPRSVCSGGRLPLALFAAGGEPTLTVIEPAARSANSAQARMISG
jgi:hypothetical protein